MIYLRRPSPTEATMLAHLSATTFTDAFGSYNKESDLTAYVHQAFNPLTVQQELADDNAVFWVAYDQEEPVGYLKLRKNHYPESLPLTHALELQRIYVHQQWQGKGVGKKLMQKAITYATEQGFDKLWLGVWEHNRKAIAFYEQWDFKVCGSHAFMLGQDRQTDLLMCLPLSHPMTMSTAQESELALIREIIRENQLPVQDLAAHVYFLVARENQEIVGVCGLEGYAPYGLLRSLAVKQHHQHKNIGTRLTQKMLQTAVEQGITQIFLLTTTAADFFKRLGFDTIERTAAPEVIQGTTEFASICPSSAICMQKQLL